MLYLINKVFLFLSQHYLSKSCRLFQQLVIFMSLLKKIDNENENVAETTTRRKSAKQPKATHGSSMNDKEIKFRKTVDSDLSKICYL